MSSWWLAAHLGLNVVELTDHLHSVRGDRCRTSHLNVVELPARVRPACGLDNLA